MLKNPQLKNFANAKINKSAKIYDSVVSKEGEIEKNTNVSVKHFVEGQFVDVRGHL